MKHITDETLSDVLEVVTWKIDMERQKERVKKELKSKGYTVDEPKKSKLELAREKIDAMWVITEQMNLEWHVKKVKELYESAIKELEEQLEQKDKEIDKDLTSWLRWKRDLMSDYKSPERDYYNRILEALGEKL